MIDGVGGGKKSGENFFSDVAKIGKTWQKSVEKSSKKLAEKAGQENITFLQRQQIRFSIR